MAVAHAPHHPAKLLLGRLLAAALVALALALGAAQQAALAAPAGSIAHDSTLVSQQLSALSTSRSFATSAAV